MMSQNATCFITTGCISTQLNSVPPPSSHILSHRAHATYVIISNEKEKFFLPSSLLTSKLCRASWWQTLSCRGQNLLSCLDASRASVLVHKLCISRINLAATQIYEEKSRLCITLSSQLVKHTLGRQYPFLNELD